MLSVSSARGGLPCSASHLAADTQALQEPATAADDSDADSTGLKMSPTALKLHQEGVARRKQLELEREQQRQQQLHITTKLKKSNSNKKKRKRRGK